MEFELTPVEARIIGSLIEKAITTPEHYPLSLNALTAACNQKSNREPVMALDEGTVQQTLDDLARRHLVTERSGFGSRVSKYAHRLCNTEFGRLHFSPQALAIVCELLLRGPQTPGELRSRAQRMAPFTDASQVEEVLEQLAVREDGPFVERMVREAGKREVRYRHLLGPAQGGAEGEDEERGMAHSPPAVGPGGDELVDRITGLEQEVGALREALERLTARLAAWEERNRE